MHPYKKLDKIKVIVDNKTCTCAYIQVRVGTDRRVDHAQTHTH